MLIRREIRVTTSSKYFRNFSRHRSNSLFFPYSLSQNVLSQKISATALIDSNTVSGACQIPEEADQFCNPFGFKYRKFSGGNFVYFSFLFDCFGLLRCFSASWCVLGAILAPTWLFGSSWALLGSLLAVFLAPPGPFWASLRLSRVSLGPLLGLP